VLVGAVRRGSGCHLNKNWRDDGGQHESHKKSFHLASPNLLRASPRDGESLHLRNAASLGVGRVAGNVAHDVDLNQKTSLGC
jgi:hypothetical protein